MHNSRITKCLVKSFNISQTLLRKSYHRGGNGLCPPPPQPWEGVAHNLQLTTPSKYLDYQLILWVWKETKSFLQFLWLIFHQKVRIALLVWPPFFYFFVLPSSIICVWSKYFGSSVKSADHQNHPNQKSDAVKKKNCGTTTKVIEPFLLLIELIVTLLVRILFYQTNQKVNLISWCTNESSHKSQFQIFTYPFLLLVYIKPLGKPPPPPPPSSLMVIGTFFVENGFWQLFFSPKFLD